MATKKQASPHDSVIIQAGIIVIIVGAIAITAFVFANYYPVAQVGAGY